MRWRIRIVLLSMGFSVGLSACSQGPTGPVVDEGSGKVTATDQVSNSVVGAWMTDTEGAFLILNTDQTFQLFGSDASDLGRRWYTEYRGESGTWRVTNGNRLEFRIRTVADADAYRNAGFGQAIGALDADENYVRFVSGDVVVCTFSTSGNTLTLTFVKGAKITSMPDPMLVFVRVQTY